MEETLISVIIPVYNVENYLSECLESVREQRGVNLQILLIEDGSPDGCAELCDAYAAKDARIEVIHQSNAGVSAARNRGLASARGTYVVFVDSDDRVPTDAFRRLLEAMGDASLVMGRMERIDEKGAGLGTDRNFPERDLNRNEFLRDLFEEKKYSYLGYLCDKMFVRQIIEDNGIRFDPEVRLNEDRLFLMRYLRFCSRVAVCQQTIYEYRQRSGGMILESRRNSTVTDAEMTVIRSFEMMQQIGKEESEALYFLVCRKSFESALDLWNRVCRDDRVKTRQIRNFLWNSCRKTLANPCLTGKERLKLVGHAVLKK